MLIAHPSGGPATIDSTATSLLSSSGADTLLVCNVGQISGAGSIKVVHVDLDVSLDMDCTSFSLLIRLPIVTVWSIRYCKRRFWKRWYLLAIEVVL